MLLDSNPKLEDLIVELVAKQSSISAFDMQNKLIEEAHEFTIQAIYKTLRNLESSGVVVKNRQKYSLRTSWVLDVSNFAKEALQNNVRNTKVLPAQGKRVIWHFNNLLTLNNFWSQILLLLVNQSKSKQLLTWMPRPWFHLAYSDQEEQYVKSLDITNTKLYLINGGNSFLDQWAQRYWKKENIEYSNSESWFHFKEQDVYLNIIDDFVLTVKLDDKITAEIEKLYSTVKSFDDLEFSEIFRIFGTKVKASMWLENNSIKASQYRKKFVDYFGIKNDQIDKINI